MIAIELYAFRTFEILTLEVDIKDVKNLLPNLFVTLWRCFNTSIALNISTLANPITLTASWSMLTRSSESSS